MNDNEQHASNELKILLLLNHPDSETILDSLLREIAYILLYLFHRFRFQAFFSARNLLLLLVGFYPYNIEDTLSWLSICIIVLSQVIKNYTMFLPCILLNLLDIHDTTFVLRRLKKQNDNFLADPIPICQTIFFLVVLFGFQVGFTK